MKTKIIDMFETLVAMDNINYEIGHYGVDSSVLFRQSGRIKRELERLGYTVRQDKNLGELYHLTMNEVIQCSVYYDELFTGNLTRAFRGQRV